MTGDQNQVIVKCRPFIVRRKLTIPFRRVFRKLKSYKIGVRMTIKLTILERL